MTEDIEVLRAQLAAAEARAKIAEAEAARAQVEALKAALQQAENQPPGAAQAPAETPPGAAQSPTETPPGAAPSPTEAPPTTARAASPAALPPFCAEVAPAFEFEGSSFVLGTIMEGTAPVPEALARMPVGMFNRHMLVAGATGTGKTRTLQLLTENLSDAGSSVLLCDVKGDLTGMAQPGEPTEKLLARTAANGQDWAPKPFPVEILKLGDNQSTQGIPVRVPVSDFGPILLARALELNTTQEQSLALIFSWADSNGLELIDLNDIRAVITHLTSADGKAELAKMGGVSTATAGVILRAISALQSQGADEFFGVPGFDTADLLRQVGGQGVISLLQIGDIFARPNLVSAVIMWLLADLFASLPEVGDPEVPKLVFFFDEAHLLFASATKEFLRQVVQTVRLIRSKGVGVVFVTQTPKDIPADVLAQLGSKIQHVLRAATPEDQKKLTQTVATFPKTSLDLAEVLTTLGTGEAAVTVLLPSGHPSPVVPVKLWAPASVMAPAQPSVVAQMVANSPLNQKYSGAYNPESAEEKLETQRAEVAAAKQQALEDAEAAKARDAEIRAAEKEVEKQRVAAEKAAAKELERKAREAEKAAVRRQRSVDTAVNSALRSMSSGIGREISRSIFGNRRR